MTYNRLPLLRQCLAALAAQTAQDLTIFLVDNASTDGTAEAVAEMALPNLVYRNTGKNLGIRISVLCFQELMAHTVRMPINS